MPKQYQENRFSFGSGVALDAGVETQFAGKIASIYVEIPTAAKVAGEELKITLYGADSSIMCELFSVIMSDIDEESISFTAPCAFAPGYDIEVTYDSSLGAAETKVIVILETL